MSDNMDMPPGGYDDEYYEAMERQYSRARSRRHAPDPAAPPSRPQKGMVTQRGAVWIDGSGRERAVAEMETDHILNCILMIEDKRSRLADLATRFKRTPLPLAQKLEDQEYSIRTFLDELDRRGMAQR